LQVTTELDLLVEEYISVLHLWNEFALEKWRAQRMLQGGEQPDTVERVYKADGYIEAASTAARYIEAHALENGLVFNFNRLFFQIHQVPGTGAYPTDNVSMDWEDDDSAFVVQPRRQPPPVPIALPQHVPIQHLAPIQPIIPQQHFRMSSLNSLSSLNMPFTACPPMPTWSYYMPPVMPSQMVQV